MSHLSREVITVAKTYFGEQLLSVLHLPVNPVPKSFNSPNTKRMKLKAPCVRVLNVIAFVFV